MIGGQKSCFNKLYNYPNNGPIHSKLELKATGTIQTFILEKHKTSEIQSLAGFF
jgi:hypothetical protein